MLTKSEYFIIGHKTLLHDRIDSNLKNKYITEFIFYLK